MFVRCVCVAVCLSFVACAKAPPSKVPAESEALAAEPPVRRATPAAEESGLSSPANPDDAANPDACAIARPGKELERAGVRAQLQGDDSFEAEALTKAAPDSVPSLLAIAELDADPMTRSRAVHVLGLIGCAPTSGLLAKLLRDRDRQVRMSAAIALGNVLEDRATAILGDALRDPDSGVQKFAVKTLHDVGDARAIPPLEEFARRTTEDWLAALARDAVVAIRARTARP